MAPEAGRFKYVCAYECTDTCQDALKSTFLRARVRISLHVLARGTSEAAWNCAQAYASLPMHVYAHPSEHECVCVCLRVNTPRSVYVLSLHVNLQCGQSHMYICTDMANIPVQVTILICQYLGVTMGTGERKGKGKGRPPPHPQHQQPWALTMALV